jgi:hypothetical protein
MVILCPFCKNMTPSKTILAEEVLEKGYKMPLSVCEREHKYKCPRCKSEFRTIERFALKINPNHIPNSEDLDKYDERIKNGKEPSRQPVSKDVQELIEKVFGEDIKKDLLDKKDKRNKESMD